MPIYNKFDKTLKRSYFQYGTTGKKYYYSNSPSKILAYKKALRQTKAINISKKKRQG